MARSRSPSSDGTQTRIEIARDEDGYRDRDELDAGSDPADPLSVAPGGSTTTTTTYVPSTTVTTTTTPAPGDADGVRDAVDDCPTIANPDQADADGDGLGDASTARPPTPCSRASTRRPATTRSS